MPFSVLPESRCCCRDPLGAADAVPDAVAADGTVAASASVVDAVALAGAEAAHRPDADSTRAVEVAGLPGDQLADLDRLLARDQLDILDGRVVRDGGGGGAQGEDDDGGELHFVERGVCLEEA